MTLHDPCRAALPGLHVLQLPGWQGSGPGHWQTRWEALHGDARVQQSDWTWPLRGDWMMRLDEAVLALADAASAAGAPPPAIALAAHSLGCQLTAAWAAHSRHAGLVRAALLVAPPDTERPDMPPQIHSFAPIVRQRLPFPALALASSDDPFCGLERARGMAADWGARLLETGPRGHLNADSGLGDWPEGLHLLQSLMA